MQDTNESAKTVRTRAGGLTHAAALVLVSASAATAADRQWNGSLGDGAWISNANWSATNGTANQTPPGSTTSTINQDTAYFRSNVYGTVLPDPNRNIKNVTFANANVSAFTLGQTTGNALLLSAGGTIADTISKASTNETVSAPLLIEAADQTTAGAYTFRNDSTGGSGDALLINGTIAAAPTLTGAATLVLTGTNATATSRLSGVVSNGSASSLGITVAGGTAATWVLNNAMTYTGPTTVSGGTLQLNATASIANSTRIIVGDAAASGALLNVNLVTNGFHVAAGQTFGGLGSVVGAVSVNAGGTIGGGTTAALSRLAITGTTTFDGTLAARLDLTTNGVTGSGGTAAGANDVLAVTGNVTIDPSAALNLTAFNGTAPAGPQTYVLIDNTATGVTAGAFAAGNVALPDGLQYTLNYAYDAEGDGANNDVAITVSSATPEPAASAALAAAGGLLARRRTRVLP